MVQTPIRPNAPEERQEVIDWLLAHNYPALPVAPAQDAKKHPKVSASYPEQGVWTHCPLTEKLEPIQLYTGKNPSYLDHAGSPHLVNHRQYQHRLPNALELEDWFTNQRNGVGTLGGWNNTVWLDFDVKQFQSQEECDAAVAALLQRIPKGNSSQQQTLIERSHSGGWRVAFKLKQKPNFTNFSLSPGGSHVGEALFTGRFTVLAPTIGPSGNPYRSINRTLPASIESLSAMEIYAAKKGLRKGNRKPELAPPHPSPVDYQSPLSNSGSIPLESLGHDTSRNILQGQGSNYGDRSLALSTAIQEWYGWQNWGENNGIPISGNTLQLAHHAGSLLGLDTDRIHRILKTIEPTECQPAALYRGGEQSCWQKISRLDRTTFEAKCPAHIKAAISQNKAHYGSTKHSSVHCRDSGSGNTNQALVPNHSQGAQNIESHSPTTKALITIRTQIKNILIQDLSPSDLQAAKIQIRADNPGVSEREISRLFETIETELETEESREQRAKEVDNLLKLTDQSLNIQQFLPPDLAQPLEELAQGLNIRPEVCLTSLLVAVSSLHKTNTELVIHRGQGFSVPPTIFAGLVSESGQKKSPILKAIIKKPLAVLQRENRERFEEALSRYEKELVRWEKCSSDERENKFPEGKPKKPQQRLYYFTNSTGEGLLYQFQAHPDKALLALVDELVGLFASQNKYSGGRGSDRQDILSAFDGTGATILRAAGAKADIEGLSLSICGTIQPEVLKRLMRDCSDPDGQWARFLFVNQPLAAATLNDDEGNGLDLTGHLLNYYRAVDQLPARVYHFSREAFSHYQPVYNQLERLRVSHPNPGMRAVYSKMEGYIGRLALNLHILHELASGKNIPSDEVSLQALTSAIALAKFYIGQVKLIHANCSADLGETAPHLAKIVELSKRMDTTIGNSWIKAKVVQSGYDNRHRPRPDAIRSWFRELEALSLGSTRGAGIRLEYSWKLPDLPLDEQQYRVQPNDTSSKSQGHKVEKSGEKWITSPPLETTQIQAFTQKEEKVDNQLASYPLVSARYGESEFFSSCDSLLSHDQTPLSPLVAHAPKGKEVAYPRLSQGTQGFENLLLPPELKKLVSFPDIGSSFWRLPKCSSSLLIPPHSTSPLFGCDDGMAFLKAVESYSTFSPLRETHSTFFPWTRQTASTSEWETKKRVMCQESFETIQKGVSLKVFPLNSDQDFHNRKVMGEGKAKTASSIAALPQNPELPGLVAQALVSVEEVTSASLLEESELLALVRAVAIQGHRSFLVKWRFPAPDTVVAVEPLTTKMVFPDNCDSVAMPRLGCLSFDHNAQWKPQSPLAGSNPLSFSLTPSVELEWQGIASPPPCLEAKDIPAEEQQRLSKVDLFKVGVLPSPEPDVLGHQQGVVQQDEAKPDNSVVNDPLVSAVEGIPDTVFKKGDRVYWSKCPSHCEQFAPFEITALDGDYAKLDLFEKPVWLAELSLFPEEELRC